VQAQQRARLSVQVRPSVPDGSLAADISIERLGQKVEREHSVGLSQSVEEDEEIARAQVGRGTQATDALEILAHVARLGDISVPAGEWIAGPDSPARIEGLSLKWRGGSGHPDLKYAVRTGGRNSTLIWGNGDGSFVGTRGQARPLTEVRFEIGGSEAENSELVVEALFQGASPVRAEGRKIRLTGPSGQEALVGLRIEVVDAAAPDEVSVVTSGRGVKAADRESKGSGSRVRVFRSTPQLQRRS
jgi:hypothetical protein